MHGAGAALPQSAAEVRIVQSKIVAQHIEERRVGIGGDGMGASVYAERKFLTHSGESSCMRRSRSRRWCCLCRTIHKAGRLGTGFARNEFLPCLSRSEVLIRSSPRRPQRSSFPRASTTLYALSFASLSTAANKSRIW